MDSRQTTVIVMLGLYTGLAIATGVLIGYEEGYQDALGGVFDPDLSFDSVDTVEEHRIDGYTIRLQPWNITENGGRTGYTTTNNDIYIYANQSIRNIYVTCVHEKLHNLHPDREHDWIYRESTQRVDHTCLRLLTQLNTTNTATGPTTSVSYTAN